MLTGILNDGQTDEAAAPEWTKEELENGKPLLLYYFVEGVMDAGNDNYKLSQAFEVKVLAKDKVIEQINDNWRAKKVGLDMEADLSKAENQARIEFWSFTGVKMGDINIKDRVSSRAVMTTLNQMEAKNRNLCKAAIKDLEKAEKAASEE